MIYELIWTVTGESPSGQPHEVATALDLDAAKRELLQGIARKNLLRCAECGGENRSYFLHLPMVLGGQSFHLVERGGAVDGTETPGQSPAQGRVWYSRQLLLSNTRAVPAGPARLLRERAIWPAFSSDQPRHATRKEFNLPPLAPVRAATWGKIAGDPGWGGIPLEAHKRQLSCRLKVAPTIAPDTVLDLLVESQSLLEALIRWRIPLCYQAWMPAKYASVSWQVAHSMRQLTAPPNPPVDEFALDLTQPLGEANNPFAKNARDGNWAEWQQLNSDSPAKDAVTRPAADPEYRLRPALDNPGEAAGEAAGTRRFKLKTSETAKSRLRSPPFLIAAGAGAVILVGSAAYWFFGGPTSRAESATSESDASGEGPTDEGGTAETAPPPPAASPLAVVLGKLARQVTVVKLPDGPADDAATLLDFAVDRELARQLEFGMALPKEYINLSFFAGPDNADLVRNLKSGLGEGEAVTAEAEVRLRRISSDGSAATRLLWRWLSAPPSGSGSTWRLGALQIGEKGQPPALSLPLLEPQRQASGSLVSMLAGPPEIPAISNLPPTKSAEEAAAAWRLAAIALPALTKTPASAEQVKWNPPSSRDTASAAFTPDRGQLEQLIKRRLNAAPNSDAERSVAEEMQRFPNFGFSIAASVTQSATAEDAPPNRPKISFQLVVPCPFNSEEPRDGAIPLESTSSAEAAARTKLLNDLQRLCASDYGLSKAEVTRLRDWLDSAPSVAPDPDDCRLLTRYLLVEELSRAVATALDSQLQFQVLRRTELLTKTGTATLDIPAFNFE